MRYKLIYNSPAVEVVEKPTGIESSDVSDLICHRLDRDTSGLLIVAKSEKYKEEIQNQFRERKVEKFYQALILSKLKSREVVEGWLERDPKDRRLMRLAPGFVKSGDRFSQVEKNEGRNKRYSKSIFANRKHYYKKIFKSNREQFNYFTLIDAQIVTGRKHQIRAHLKHLDSPIIGDSWYSNKISREASNKLGVDQLMLHASKIRFYDPSQEKLVEVESVLPPRFNKLISKLDEI